MRRPTRHSQARGGRGKAEGPGEGGGGRGPAMTSAAVVVNHGWVVSPCKLKKKGEAMVCWLLLLFSNFSKVRVGLGSSP